MKSLPKHAETMARRQEKYALRLKSLRDSIEFAREPMPGWGLAAAPPEYIAQMETALERLERYCGLRPSLPAPPAKPAPPRHHPDLESERAAARRELVRLLLKGLAIYEAKAESAGGV